MSCLLFVVLFFGFIIWGKLCGKVIWFELIEFFVLFNFCEKIGLGFLLFKSGVFFFIVIVCLL